MVFVEVIFLLSMLVLGISSGVSIKNGSPLKVNVNVNHQHPNHFRYCTGRQSCLHAEASPLKERAEAEAKAHLSSRPKDQLHRLQVRHATLTYICPVIV